MLQKSTRSTQKSSWSSSVRLWSQCNKSFASSPIQNLNRNSQSLQAYHHVPVCVSSRKRLAEPLERTNTRRRKYSALKGLVDTRWFTVIEFAALASVIPRGRGPPVLFIVLLSLPLQPLHYALLRFLRHSKKNPSHVCDSILYSFFWWCTMVFLADKKSW